MSKNNQLLKRGAIGVVGSIIVISLGVLTKTPFQNTKAIAENEKSIAVIQTSREERWTNLDERLDNTDTEAKAIESRMTERLRRIEVKLDKLNGKYTERTD